MPEGAEIRRAADRVAKAIRGRIADEVFFAFDELRPFEKTLQGRLVQEVTSHGKAMLTRNGRLPKTRRQLRFAVSAEGRRALLYSASDIEVLDAEAERTHPFLSRLGPDVLSQLASVTELSSRLGEARFRGRQLGARLLEQRFVAGLGNYLHAEIFFEAGIHPRRRAADCSDDERRRLADRIVALTKRTYRTRGITRAPSRVAQLKAAGAKRSEYRFWVYGRDGAACRVCEEQLEMEPVGGRKCFWCPSCQPVGGDKQARRA